VVPPPPAVNLNGKSASINESTKVAPPPPAITVAQSESIDQIAAPVAGPPKRPAIPGAPGPAVNVASGPATATTEPVSSAADAPPSAEEQPEAEVSASAVSPEVPLPALALRAAHPDFRTTFRVKYVAEGVAYLDGGRAAGLAEGMKLVVRETAVGDVAVAADASDPAAVAELDVTSVAETSAITEIRSPKRDVKTGDIAYLSVDDEQALVQKSALSATRKYPTVISFTEGDTLDEEVRAEIPRPPMPSVNRARGRIGVDYMATLIHGSTSGSNTNLGLVARLDLTRIGGTYWTLSGYWRGRLNRGSYSGVDTIQDLLNRTYHLSLTYDNPTSRWVAGVGRMYLPWATSLDTIDGGYFGARLGHGSTLGIFAGSTPDPTSWSYNPDRRIAGTFVNFEGGSWDAFRYTSTSGAGLSTIDWNLDRPFIFLENGIFYKRYLSFYDALQLDSPQGNAYQAPTGAGVGRNFTTVRFMPISRLEFDANYNYMRDLPTFDTNLIGTGLLDKYLFQGFNGGVRVEVLKQIWLYTSLGRGNRSGDTSSSLNELFGITFGHIPWLAVRVDAHYSKFDSSFGSGYYGTFSLSRSLNDRLRIEILGGQQDFTSSYTADGRSRFVTGNIETNLGRHYFIQGGFTFSRGAVQNYDQWLLSLGYRFDSKKVGAQ
jgi:hypothetical protein